MSIPIVTWRKFRLTSGTLLRMAADAVLLQVALIGALALRFYLVFAFQNERGDVDAGQLLRLYQDYFLRTAPPLTLLCLAIFFFSGFYTSGRYYQSRYKIGVVIWAVTCSFVGYGFVVLFLDLYDGTLSFARGALVLAWVLSIVLLAGARVWNQVWQKAARPELNHRKVAVSKGRREILVIGGAGYIGSALVPKLLTQGYRVRVLDLMMFGQAPLDGVKNHANLKLVRGDFRHLEKVVQAMNGVDSVVHLGAIVGDPACSLDEKLTIDVNLSSTRMIAELAKSQDIERFIFASTCSVYGACDETLDERSQPRPLGLYGRTKYASENVLQQMVTPDFAPTILRFATIYGLSGRTRFDLVVNLLAAKAKIDGKITIYNGDQWRPFVHVDDAAAAIVLILSAPLATVGGQIFNVGSNDQNFTIRQIGQLIHQQVVAAEVLCEETERDPRNYRVDFGKIRHLLNFRPRWTVEAGIQQVLEAIASGQVTDYRDPKFSNADYLSLEGTASLDRDQWARQLIEHLTGRQ